MSAMEVLPPPKRWGSWGGASLVLGFRDADARGYRRSDGGSWWDSDQGLDLQILLETEDAHLSSIT